MEDFDIFRAPEQPFIVDYQNRLWEEKEVQNSDSEPIEVDPIKLSTAWTKEVNMTKDSISFMSYVRKLTEERLNKESFVDYGYAPGQFPSYSSYMSRTQPYMGIFSRLSDRYPIQPDTGTKD
jgi:hypothetical protein